MSAANLASELRALGPLTRRHLIVAPNLEVDELHELVGVLGVRFGDDAPAVIAGPRAADLSALGEDEMRAAGWIRLERYDELDAMWNRTARRGGLLP